LAILFICAASVFQSLPRIMGMFSVSGAGWLASDPWGSV